MKYYYLNKIAMAVLVALLLFFGTRTIIDIAYQEHPPEKPGYEVAGTEGDGHGEKEKPADKGAEFIAALNKADPAKGEQDVGLCKVCHSFEKDGPTMIGPNVYGVVGHKIAAHEGFNYSPALREHEDQEWTFENLDKWLANPQEFAPGTSMAFPGIPDLQKRANVVAYLNKNSDDPLPIPEPKAEEAAPEEAADEGGEEGAAGKPEILTLLASADAAKGEQAAALCKVCHTFEAGGATMVGPNLHNVVGADIAAHEDFSYSEALKAKDGKWTYEQLDAWLINPQAFAAGTTMVFPGVPDAKKRADIIKFLMSMTENPPPLPAADEEVAPAEEEAAPAETEEAAPAEEEPAPAEEEAAPAEEEAAPAKDEAMPAESEDAAPAEEEAAPAKDEAMPAESEDAAPAEEEDAAPAEEPAAEEPAAEEEAPLAAEPEEPSVTDEPAADEVMEEGREEIIVNPPTVSEDAPSEPSTGEAPSASQPQPVYPDEASDGADDGMSADDSDTMTESGDGASDEMDSSSDDGMSSQPQPVYPDGKPEGL